MTSYIFSLDMYVLQTLYALREPGWVLAAIWISELGEWYMICGLAVALALWLALRRKFAIAQGLLLAAATSGILTFLLKGFVARPRPPQYYWAYTETWYSFPSAHATMAFAFYGFLAYLAWRSKAKRTWRIAAVVIAVILVLAIGFARLYLGVHYLSDVIGGYVLASACLWLAIKLTRMLESR